MTCFDLSDLESRSCWSKYKLFRELTMKNPHTELVAGSIIHSYRIHKLIHCVDLGDLESRSRWPKYELIRDLPLKNPHTELGDAESIISKVIVFTSRNIGLTSVTLKVGQGDLNTNSSESFPWVIHIPKKLTSATSKVGQGDLNTNSFETFPWRIHIPN